MYFEYLNCKYLQSENLEFDTSGSELQNSFF